ncbi:hypothetical protein SAMD00023353_2201430 [Rosellinia necatrix]|uniref:Accumulation-associated protein n=1 Tax=Rosellinia necatrix TaxID=77044 RepID=A0A1S7UP24_ROSNE|nr:hypothetical protein SAMD00023353_2201430 [Rosellinia necatrix]
MRFSHASALALSFQLSLAHPSARSRRALIPGPDAASSARPHVVDIRLPQAAAAAAERGPGKDTPKAVADEEKAPAGPAEEAAEEGEEENEDEVDIAGTLDTPVALEGGDIKQDVTFPASVGEFEVEFQAKTARTLTVSENKTPVAAPAGFTALEPSSFKVALAEGGDALTLGQIDFIFNTTNAALTGVDLSKSRVGKLCTETNTFVIDDALGEAEFEVDENEIVLKVTDLSGEFGIFVPQAAAGEGAEAGAGEDAGADAGAEEGAEEEEEDKAGQIEVAGLFGSINKVEANVFTNLNFPANAAGSLEVEYNSTVANTILVAPRLASVAPPAGHLFVDPLTFAITTATPPQAGDALKVDYIFTPAMKAAIDPAQGRPARLDPLTQQFVTDGLGEFEFEVDEDEWSLTVTDLNGEWAFVVPESAVL